MKIKLPDGVLIEVPIEAMAVKDSIFVPTMKSVETRALLREIAKEMGYKFVFATHIVDGYVGVEFWRVDGLK